MSILGCMIGDNDSRVLKSSFHCNSDGQIAQMSEKLHLKKVCKRWNGLEGHCKSLEMSQFNRSHTALPINDLYK